MRSWPPLRQADPLLALSPCLVLAAFCAPLTLLRAFRQAMHNAALPFSALRRSEGVKSWGCLLWPLEHFMSWRFRHIPIGSFGEKLR